MHAEVFLVPVGPRVAIHAVQGDPSHVTWDHLEPPTDATPKCRL